MRSPTNLLISLLILQHSPLFARSDDLPQTNVARNDNPTMVLLTLAGAMVAIDPHTAAQRWRRQHEPVMRTSGDQNFNVSSIFLPDPVTGRLYSMRASDRSHELARTPFTIPELVLQTPFVSADRILFTGRKADSWHMINAMTGECRTVMDFDNHHNKSTHLMPLPSLHDVYIGKTHYDVCMTSMHPENGSREAWNVSMYQYSAFEMNKDIYDKYEFLHIVSSSSGRILTLLKNSGKVLWHKSDLNSPVVGLFMMSHSGFLNIPFTTVDDGVFDKILQPNEFDMFKGIRLLETIFIGENKSAGVNSFYALPSLSDNSTFIIRDKVVNFLDDPSSIIGHYFLHSAHRTEKLITHEVAAKTSDSKKTVGNSNVDVKILVAAMVVVSCATVAATVAFRRKIKEELSSRGRRKRKASDGDDRFVVESKIKDDGTTVVSKIRFNRVDLIGKGSEGTAVFRGTFEGRKVAVKRLLVSSFSLADREVKMLQQSDAHENIVRYFCTEFDREFCYIALELCACSLYDYALDEGHAPLRQLIKPKEVLVQATRGLSHLHQLNVIHRDIKPQNILISLPDSRNCVRALISDFGLCKVVDKGEVSMTNRNGAAGTEGWIAPELLQGQKLSKNADIFSLGCVFYFALTGGCHPFGDALHRTANIVAGTFDLDRFSDTESTDIFARELVADMISRHPLKRPVIDAILRHPLFWSEGKVLDFLHSVSDRVERLTTTEEPLWSLERNAREIVRGDWKAVIDEEILNDLGKQRSYHGISVRDLLRAIRNKRNHYMELTDEVKAIFGTIPNDYLGYWLKRFPRLASHAYHVMSSRAKEATFVRFYVRYHTFTRPAYLADHSLDNHELVEVQARCRAEAKSAFSGSPGGRKFNGNWTRNKSKRGSYNFRFGEQ